MLLVAAGCATPIGPGSQLSELYRQAGQPEDRWEQPDGTQVLMYPAGAFGRESWRVVVGRDGTVRSVEQVLREERLAGIKAGMSKDQVRRELGRPAETMQFSKQNEEVWRWRYIDFAEHRKLFDVRFDPAGRVTDTLSMFESSLRGRNSRQSRRASG
jgi:hypothetical protein